MINDDAFKEGWNYILEHSALFVGQKYCKDSLVQEQDLINEINTFIDNLNKYNGNESNPEQLKGYIAEEFHTYTFNINAILSKSKSRAHRLNSNGVGSVDVEVITENGVKIPYSLKYYSTGRKSAVSQSINLIEKFKEYEHSSKNPISMEEYFFKNGWNIEDAYISLYLDQGRVIASDQLEDAIKFIEERIKRNIGKEGKGRTIDINRWKNTLEKLSSVIKDENGITSIELTKDDSRVLAELSKKGLIDTKIINEKCGIDAIKELYKIAFKDSIKAGLSSGIINLIFAIIPEIYKIIDYLIKTKELDKDDLKELGKHSIKSFSKGFLYGSVSCLMINLSNIGKFGSYLKGVNPSVIGALSTIILNVAFNMFNATKGKINYKDVGTSFAEEVIIMAASIGGGMLGQIILSGLPVFGYFIGSFIGSTLAGFTINVSKKITLALCENTGFTCFGLVEQDYTLPEYYLKELGINLIELNKVDINQIDIELIELKQNNIDYIDIETIKIKTLRRGVLEVKKIGYIL